MAGDPFFDHVEGEVEGGVSDRVQGKRPSGRVGAQDAAAQALLVVGDLAAHRRLGDRRDLGLLAGHRRDLVDALDRD